MSRQREPGRDQEASEVERIPGVSVWTRNRQSLVLGDVSRGPGADEDSDECDHRAR